eukprot:1717686-Ditylum_brightwellii.AAC.1
MSPDLDEEWLTEGEDLARSTAERQEILRSSGPPDANSDESILLSQPENSPIFSPHVGRGVSSTSIHDPVIPE